MNAELLIQIENRGCIFKKNIPYPTLIAILTYCKLNSKQLIDFQKSFPNLMEDMEKYFDKRLKYLGIDEILQETNK
jgi:hypothetical protein